MSSQWDWRRGFRAFEFIFTRTHFHRRTFPSLSLSAAVFVRCRTCDFYLLSFCNFSIVHFRRMAEEAPTLQRDSTMAVTAKVSIKSKAREQEKSQNEFMGYGFSGKMNDYFSSFFWHVRKVKRFLRSMEKSMKMRKLGLSKKNSKKLTKMRPASSKGLPLWQPPHRYGSTIRKLFISFAPLKFRSQRTDLCFCTSLGGKRAPWRWGARENSIGDRRFERYRGRWWRRRGRRREQWRWKRELWRKRCR